MAIYREKKKVRRADTGRDIRSKAVRVYVLPEVNEKYLRAARLKRTTVSTLIAELVEPHIDAIITSAA